MVEILHVLSVKYYVYIFIHLCVNLQISTACYLYYDVQWFSFWGRGLSNERAVAHSLHVSLFPLGVYGCMCVYLWLCMHSSMCVHIEGFGAAYSVLTYKYEWEYVMADFRVLVNEHIYDYTWG